jgi:hypothetical protein
MKVGIRVVICKGSTTGYDKLGAPVVPKGRAGGEDEAGETDGDVAHLGRSPDEDLGAPGAT